jgi:Predicted membrane protein (DUF2157)
LATHEQEFISQLEADAAMDAETLQSLRQPAAAPLFSVHWELKTILYAGVLLLSGGLGILVYKNIDTIGHLTILIAIGLITLGCFGYCIKTAAPFTIKRQTSPGLLYDYILLLGALSLLTFLGYLQYQYNVFGNRNGLATFIPMVILFISAYYFDHLGILSLAITNLAAWAGIAITPATLLKDNDFNSESLIYTGMALGVFLLAMAHFSRVRSVKAHFALTYRNFGTHLLFVSLLAAMFHYDSYFMFWIFPLAVFAYYTYREAAREKSFYFNVVLAVYLYIGCGYTVLMLFDRMQFYNTGGIYMILIYLILSSIALIRFLMNVNKKLKANDSLE